MQKVVSNGECRFILAYFGASGNPSAVQSNTKPPRQSGHTGRTRLRVPRQPLWVRSGLAYPLQGWSAVRGRADETRRKRTIGRRSSAIGGIAVVAGGEPDSLLLARSRTGPNQSGAISGASLLSGQARNTSLPSTKRVLLWLFYTYINMFVLCTTNPIRVDNTN